MNATRLQRENGMTLLETIVALVLLAIVVLYMALVPLASQNSLMRTDIQNKANQAAKDKIEFFRGVVSRWSAGPPRYSGWDTLCTAYASGSDDYRTTMNPAIHRHWTVTANDPFPRSARIRLVCFYTWRGVQDSLVYVTFAANRAAIPDSL